MDIEKRIIAFIRLGEVLRKFQVQKTHIKHQTSIGRILKEAVTKSSQKNGWFTEENVLLAITSLGEMLKEDKIRKWVSNYPNLTSHISHLTSVNVIMAGNIPLVGFHDFLCVLMSENIFVGKLSSEDEFLLPALADILTEMDPEFKEKIIFTDSVRRLKFEGRRSDSQHQPSTVKHQTAVNAFIATGSNNSARYFEYYFGKYPHIIRKNRNAIAILDGTETDEDFKNLGKDIFQYFGMGCRNVSKIYIPKDYNLDTFFAAMVDFGDVINHNKYYNNHIYYRTIYLLTKEKFLDNNFLMLKEEERIASPVATLYYERYDTKEELIKKIELKKENIQCIVSHLTFQISSHKSLSFGQTQSPELWDYADGVDTMEFLLSI